MVYYRVMNLTFLLKGIVLGFSIAAPVGPIGVLCIRRTLTTGRVSGLATGLGAATADALYGIVASLGLTVISNALVDQDTWLKLVGGGFLCYLGITTFIAKPTGKVTPTNSQSVLESYFSALLLTLTNPMTILSFAAVFAGLGIAKAAQNYLDPGLLVLGTFIGSALWWFLLVSSTSLLQEKLNSCALHWINKASGIILVVFGVLSLCSLL